MFGGCSVSFDQAVGCFATAGPGESSDIQVREDGEGAAGSELDGMLERVGGRGRGGVQD